MIDERIRNQEQWAMNLDTAKREGRDEGLREAREKLACSMKRRGFAVADIADMLEITESEVRQLLVEK